jgi:hypothetical protein
MVKDIAFACLAASECIFRVLCVGPYKKRPITHDVTLSPDGTARSKARQATGLSLHPSNVRLLEYQFVEGRIGAKFE